jgi:hypothetical protein
MTTPNPWYELRNSVFSRNFAHAEGMLAADPDLFDLRNSIGETVLHFLAVENDSEGVAWLHARGFSLNTKNRFGVPMVFEIADLSHKDLLLWLAQNGADLSAVDRKNRGIFEYLQGDPNKLDPTSPAYKRFEERRQRRQEMAPFLKESISGISQNGGRAL